ncbi:MAG TPA: ATP synthase F0 subunit B [Pyrinomonadaceae bacterium]|nr:ATP synthase F0 subunit B [Pyrinomonadaceae bacterium]
MEWFNYPGLEIWKFLNLAIFLAVAIIVLRRKINEALLARGESIKQELITAHMEREKALAQLAEAESRLSHLDEDVNLVREQARREAEAERQRLAVSTEREIEKLKQQAQREIETADKVARNELRQYLAKRSVEVARESVKSQMRPEDDTLLIRESIGALRRTTV